MIKTLPRPSYMPKFTPRSYKSLSDSGIDTDEELTDSETGIDCDADPSTAIPAGTIIRIENEYLTVSVSAPNVLTVIRGTHGSTAVAHTTNQDIYKVVKGSCVLYLEGQQDPQSSTIRDLSGYNNHGTITGATWVRLPSGLWSLLADGLDDVIITPSTSVFSGLSTLTLMGWLNTIDWGSGGDTNNIRLLRCNTPSIEWRMSQAAANTFLVIGGTNHAGAVATISLGVRQHLAAVMDGTNVYFYVNGVQKDTVAQTKNCSAGSDLIHLLNQIPPTQRGYHGYFDYFKAFNLPFSATQIAGIFNQERTLFGI